MQIKIKQKFDISSHRFGSKFLIVNSTYIVQIYPALLHFKDLNSNKNFKIFLDFKGPVKNFTISQNLKDGSIKVFFHTQQGYLAYLIINLKNNVAIYFDRLFNNEISIKLNETKSIKTKKILDLPIPIIYEKKPNEFLFLGIHKKQLIDEIHKRENILEFIPFLFLYSQFFQDIKTKKCLREHCLLRELTEKIKNKKRDQIEDSFIKVFKAHFSDGFIPRVNDEDFQNIIPIVDEKDAYPLHILRKLFYIIKSILVNQNLDEISILPSLPISFHAGKALNISMIVGSFDIEWTKKLIKRLIFRPIKDLELKLCFQSKLKTYRLRESIKQKGKFYKNRELILFEKNKTYYFDKFQK